MKIGIVGKGYVGSAVNYNFGLCFDFEVATWDVIQEKRTIDSFEEFVDWADTIFVCVPTPELENGACDTSIVEDVVRKIANRRQDVIVVIKSTVPPGTCARLSESTGLRIAFNPEFLTEANALNDFRFQSPIIVGSDDETTAEEVFKIYFKFISSVGYMPLMRRTTSCEAEMFKYLANSFLALKVIFANEIKILCDKASIDYNEVVEMAKLDSRLGKTHWAVPGPDGKMGFGGSCFPKDTSALLAFADDIGSSLWLLTETCYINEDLRNGPLYEKFRPVDDGKKVLSSLFEEDDK